MLNRGCDILIHVRAVINALISAQIAAFAGSISVCALIVYWSASADECLSLFLAILIVAWPIINLVALLVSLPLQLTSVINPRAYYFEALGAAIGGLLYVLIIFAANMYWIGRVARISVAGGFQFAVGAIYGGLFCPCIRLLTKLTKNSTRSLSP